MKVWSLFAGIGGLDLGLERAGMTVTRQCEIDAKCQRILRKQWKDVELHGDIRTFTTDGAVDLVCGGSPCQDVSIAGARAGLAGERSGLFFEFIRVIRDARPPWVVFENVHGLFSSNGGRDFEAVRAAFRELGYGLRWRTMDSRYFGVPQRRRRIIVVGHLGGHVPASVLFDGEGGAGDLGASGQEGRELAAASRSRSAIRGDEDTIVLRMREGKPGGGKGPLWRNDEALTLATANDLVVFRKSRRAQSVDDKETWVPDDETNTLNVFDVGDVRATQLVVQGYDVRRLTVTEYERLQGLPDGWTCECGATPYSSMTCTCPDTPRFKAIGNAVTVPVAEWVGRNIMAVA